MSTDNAIWTTEVGERVAIVDMDMSHLHNALTMLENTLTDVNEKLGYLSSPLPEGTRLTEEAELEVYCLKCQQIQAQRWQGILQREVSRRLRVMNRGFSKFTVPTRGPFAANDEELPALLRRQAE